MSSWCGLFCIPVCRTMEAPLCFCCRVFQAILHVGLYCYIFPTVKGKTIIVGGSVGWTNFNISNFGPPKYAAWASSQTIFPGDIIVFSFLSNFHNVNLFSSKSAFNICDFTESTVLDDGATGTFLWEAPNQPGNYYFACSKEVEGQGTHCDGGQKLKLAVLQSVISPAASQDLASVAPASAPSASDSGQTGSLSGSPEGSHSPESFKPGPRLSPTNAFPRAPRIPAAPTTLVSRPADRSVPDIFSTAPRAPAPESENGFSELSRGEHSSSRLAFIVLMGCVCIIFWRH
ncbi:hypothetical protein O6H91_23G036500 [Diphasiastrum complanatum]|uniref:Uncharacterized protein n=2 Tax=Diphasiastrum complanatum TaxID=34168 RepID=A0ACC2A9Q2_DIPCM|nr:hypothetical protein O6H91_23G036500 [Diphasiastrum complanatum]